ncbi:iron-containing alcohol dehydrogenase [Sodalis sp. RH21]|uniref:iron-containing alcohol dehydrogenase n=1 Tax=unclassified Sodalis (in: enterobacteria) TaxID=2636512 RepID=UPI0039B41C26
MNIDSTIISGYGALNDIGYLLAGKRRVLVVTDNNIVGLPAAARLLAQVHANAAGVTLIDSVPPEPSRQDVARIVAGLGETRADMVIGIGGGSVLDVAKLLSLLCAGDAEITLDSLLAGVKPRYKTLSLLIPTTAGTGSEATPNAILAITEQETKIGIISPVMIPDYVALIPELTTSMPARIAASTGIDALCHLLECFTATCANPVSDNVALTGMKKLFANIETAASQPDNLEARLNMLWASYYGGSAIAHAGTHLVHAMSYPLGGKYHIAHGIANAILLAPCMAFVRPSAVQKFARVYDLLADGDATLDDDQKSRALVDYLAALVQRLDLPLKLSQLAISPDDIPYLAQSAIDVQRLIKNVPAAVTREQIFSIYHAIR